LWENSPAANIALHKAYYHHLPGTWQPVVAPTLTPMQKIHGL